MYLFKILSAIFALIVQRIMCTKLRRQTPPQLSSSQFRLIRKQSIVKKKCIYSM